MKKIISFIGVESLPEGSGSSRKLSQAEMEYEMDHCPAPWECREACYGACVGCAQKKCGGA